MIETKLLTLDGTYGFAIYMTELGMKNNPNIRNRGRIVLDKNNKPVLFTNANIAFLVADMEFGLYKGEFKLKVIKYDPKKNKITDICNFEAMQPFGNNNYQVITKDMVYYIREYRICTVKSIRYFVFENGDIERTEKSYGRSRNKYLLKLISQAAARYLYVGGTLSGVSRISPDELEISFKNSSAKIHIMTNGLIANINKVRREDSEGLPQYKRCIPFDNTLDKYVTLFSYVTKETAESDNFGFDGEIDQDIERTYKYIQDYIADQVPKDSKLAGFKYLPIEFNGTILTKD